MSRFIENKNCNSKLPQSEQKKTNSQILQQKDIDMKLTWPALTAERILKEKKLSSQESSMNSSRNKVGFKSTAKIQSYANTEIVDGRYLNKLLKKLKKASLFFWLSFRGSEEILVR